MTQALKSGAHGTLVDEWVTARLDGGLWHAFTAAKQGIDHL